ncbi:phage major capsid protein [uncultured Tateyamaria sp.]|uniref:phage major capsid protein n=1 Tax=uncultured Tateyamaria sp. TaxID=455651 RepID=UPI0026169789|nr:phage major capsid protein [uncultured Tateyamaria sp.]
MPKDTQTEFMDVEFKFQGGDTGIIEGFASTYGGDGDGVMDVIQAGAFTNTLNAISSRGIKLKMLREHDRAKPIGVWTKLTDTPQGLKVEGQIAIDADDGRNAHALMKSGALDALSIGYRVAAFEPREGGGRILTDIELVEISVVTFPANAGAVITDVKGAIDPKTKAQKAATEGADDMPLDTASELDAKLTETKTALDKALNRIGDLEAKAQTVPAAAKGEDEPTVEQKAFAEYARAGKENMGADEVKALQNAADAQGGFLVPEDFRAELIKTVTETSPMRQVARTTSTGRDELVLPKRVTKLQGGWTAELDDRPESEPTYGQIKIPVHELGVWTSVSNANLEDSAFDMQTELTADFGESFGEMESSAFILGDGVGKPTGILTNVDIPVTPSAAAGVADADDLITTFYAVKAAYRNRGAWMMNSSMLAAVRKLKTSSGDYLWRESLADGQPATILGRPVYEAVDMPDPVPNAKAAIFGDFSRAYRIVSRVDLSVLRDPYTLAGKSAVKFHARQRVGGDVVQPEAVRVLQLA